jgi:Ca-activated chloride channel family protein
VSFARPWVLLLLLLPLLWWWWRRRQPRTIVRYSDLSLLGGRQRRPWVARLPVFLRSAAIVLLLVAAAGPRRGGEEIQITQEGIAIVVALDVSSSMLAEDFAPSNRLEVAKAQAAEFIRGRKADRIGLVAFAGEALTQVPITVDYPVLLQSVADLKVGVLEDGTAIGAGLATALNRLREAPGQSKVVLLLTDGVNNRGLIDPRTAASAAQALGVRVYTIGVGTDGEAPIPTGRGLSGFRYEVLPVEIDEELLTEIAQATGGRYFRAKDGQALGRIFRQIDELETTPIRVTRYARYEERTTVLVAVGLAILLLELLAAATVSVRVP